MDLQSIERDALAGISSSSNSSQLDEIYNRYLGRKEGELTKILRGLAELSPDEKKRIGKDANQLRLLLEEKFEGKRRELNEADLLAQITNDKIDLTLPGYPFDRGGAHPVLKAIREITRIFQQIGFDVADGPEIETEQNNFTDLNIPADHPARDMQDTFYVRGDSSLVLRTHTSPVQIRVMRTSPCPIRLISPGRVYRHEATDATHAAIFHQIEGLVVVDDVSFAHLKGTLAHFAKTFFGSDTQIRFMPSYFPFVEPGAQMDVQCFSCKGKKNIGNGQKCGLCKATGWIEMLGAGMVHPQVLRNVGYDPNKVSGYAFGMGVERIIMTRSKIKDIRLFLESDLRFLGQFA